MTPPSRRNLLLAAGAGAAAAALGPWSASAAAPVPGDRHPAAGIRVGAGHLTVGLDATGTVSFLKDARTGTDHLAPGRAAPLVSLVIDGRQVAPTAVRRSPAHPDLLTFTNRAAGCAVDVRVVDRGTFTTLVATRVAAPAGADVQTLLWGPLATAITQTVGETVGVVRDDDFAIGLRPLTDRTEGAWPQEYQDFGWETEVADNPSGLQVAAHEEWSAAGRTTWGSVLRAFTYDYTKERSRLTRAGHHIPVGPLPGGEGRIAGSTIALFGSAPDLVPTVLSEIATGEHLPYPTQNGQWQKAAQASSQSFLVLGDLTTGNIPTAARLAEAAGIGYLYSLPNAVGPWQTTGHYQFDASLGGEDAGAKAAVELARAHGMRLGVHTISDFISTDDRYVVPSPADPRLALGGRAALARPASATDTTLYLDSGAPLEGGLHGQLLRIGDEFASYGSAQQSGGAWQLTGVKRAQWGSAAVAHPSGERASRVIVNSYDGATGGRGILQEISTRLATAWNTTGISSNSYDGVESASESGWGNYGQALLINGTYRQNRTRDGFITETSRMTSNTWDALTRASWGEVGVTTMDQVFVNNEFYRANFLPGMLGWISLSGSESLLSIEGKLARGAGLNAGAGFETSVAGLEAGGDNTLRVLDAIKQWETTRNLGAFTEAQRALLRDTTTNWHLSVVEEGREWSLQRLDADGTLVGAPERVVVPTPRLTTTALPPAARGDLYAARVETNTPATVRFEVTAGALPQGLTLNRDTGGITGTPRRAGTASFTVTAHQTGGAPDATAHYRIRVAR
ncbi:Ig domain-containing protein [Streptomyces sp. NBC_00963]|uniref:Ig domain-containing protein n=1 Tax=Streptomyces sp. NBC_00963 TaxID=2903697 RepID=UPI0038663902|nr:Ig domain-containing protein [Streptomyces sp. NBC_00963]